MNDKHIINGEKKKYTLNTLYMNDRNSNQGERKIKQEPLKRSKCSHFLKSKKQKP